MKSLIKIIIISYLFVSCTSIRLPVSNSYYQQVEKTKEQRKERRNDIIVVCLFFITFGIILDSKGVL